MNKTKIDFIVDLLANKKFDFYQKERFIELTAKEIKDYGNTDLEILKEIELIKKKIGLSEEIIRPRIENSTPTTLPAYIDPKTTASFLLEYNQNPILKTTTHLIDSDLLKLLNEKLNIHEYDYEKHFICNQKEFKSISNKYKIDKNLYGKLNAYLSGKETWSEENINISWASDVLKRWSQDNPKMCPNPDEDLKQRPFNFQRIKFKSGNSLNNFSELVLHFKKQITIRDDNSLSDLCKKWNFQFNNKVEFDFSDMPKNINFFTDVEKVNQAYEKLIRLCIDESSSFKPVIKLNLQERKTDNMTQIIFSIHHINSKFHKSLNEMNRYGTVFTGLISKQLNGLCNWDLTTDFDNNEFGHISLWPKTDIIERLEKFDGVKFDLIFYR